MFPDPFTLADQKGPVPCLPAPGAPDRLAPVLMLRQTIRRGLFFVGVASRGSWLGEGAAYFIRRFWYSPIDWGMKWIALSTVMVACACSTGDVCTVEGPAMELVISEIETGRWDHRTVRASIAEAEIITACKGIVWDRNGAF